VCAHPFDGFSAAGKGHGTLSSELSAQRQWRVVEEACACLMMRNKMEKGSSTWEEMGWGAGAMRQRRAGGGCRWRSTTDETE
jgi:hypothetical protein